MIEPKFIDFKAQNISIEQGKLNAQSFFELMDKRRTVRDFAPDEVPIELIENCIKTASTAPSGAHKQPWTFCVVGDKEIKKQIRMAAEKEEYESYNGRMSQEWLNDLSHIGTDWHKPFLEIAPYIIVVFKRIYEPEGEHKHNNYYVSESVGLACGFLLAALHNAGLVSLTHTPSPMNFLQKILNRPVNERPFLVIPVGYAHPQAKVPNLTRKKLDEVLKLY